MAEKERINQDELDQVNGGAAIDPHFVEEAKKHATKIPAVRDIVQNIENMQVDAARPITGILNKSRIISGGNDEKRGI